MKNYILYVLPFRNGKHFKFGITSVESLKRIKGLNKIYDIDIDKSFIYRGEKSVITSTESELKIYEFLEVDDYIGLPGYTEIREVSELENTISIIENYNLKKESLVKYKEMVINKNGIRKIPNKSFVRKTGGDIIQMNLPIDINDVTGIPDIPHYLP